MLELGADINAQDDKGQTPLHVAVSRNRKCVAELLRRKDANLAIKDQEGHTVDDLEKINVQKEITQENLAQELRNKLRQRQ